MKTKTYTIEGATWASRFMQKFWFDAATVRARSKAEALREFKHSIKKGYENEADNVMWVNADAPNYVAYRVKGNANNFSDHKKMYIKATTGTPE